MYTKEISKFKQKKSIDKQDHNDKAIKYCTQQQ